MFSTRINCLSAVTNAPIDELWSSSSIDLRPTNFFIKISSSLVFFFRGEADGDCCFHFISTRLQTWFVYQLKKTFHNQNRRAIHQSWIELRCVLQIHISRVLLGGWVALITFSWVGRLYLHASQDHILFVLTHESWLKLDYFKPLETLTTVRSWNVLPLHSVITKFWVS